MTGYTKLFGSIIASTIWSEPNETRVVWITMLAMMNRNFEVESSVPGLAQMARVSIKDVEAALKCLEAPDPYSRTKDFDGCRIRPVDGGWVILNGEKYRNKMNKDERREYLARKQRERRERLKEQSNVNNVSTDVTVGNISSTPSTQEEEEVQEENTYPPPKSGFSDGKVVKDTRPTTEQSKRFAAIVRRRLTTPWSDKEIAAYKKLAIVDEEDLAAVETRYREVRKTPDAKWLTQDLLTILNNWTTQVDRAHAYMSTRATTSVTQKPSQSAPTPDWRRILNEHRGRSYEDWQTWNEVPHSDRDWLNDQLKTGELFLVTA